MGGGVYRQHTSLLTCKANAVLRTQLIYAFIYFFFNNKTHLEKVILVHNTAVGQRLDQLIRQSGLATISDSIDKKGQMGTIIKADVQISTKNNNYKINPLCEIHKFILKASRVKKPH